MPALCLTWDFPFSTVRLVSTHITPSAPEAGSHMLATLSFMFVGKGQRKTLGTSLQPFPFRFVMELFEGFCCDSHFQERKPPLPHPAFLPSPKSLAGVNQWHSRICSSCGAILHVRVTAKKGWLRLPRCLRDCGIQ